MGACTKQALSDDGVRRNGIDAGNGCEHTKGTSMAPIGKYGEPLTTGTGVTGHLFVANSDGRAFPRDERVDDDRILRLIRCTNAMVGIDDPAAYMREARQAISNMAMLIKLEDTDGTNT